MTLKYISRGNLMPPCNRTQNIILKLLSSIFYQIFIFSPNDSPLKTNDLHKFADVIFGITQKQLNITSLNLVR